MKLWISLLAAAMVVVIHVISGTPFKLDVETQYRHAVHNLFLCTSVYQYTYGKQAPIKSINDGERLHKGDTA